MDLLTDNQQGPPLSLIRNKYVQDMNGSIQKSALDFNQNEKFILPDSVNEVYDHNLYIKGEPWDRENVKKLANQNLFEMSHLNSPDKFINVTNGASYTTTNKKGVPHKIVGRGPSQSGLDLSHMTLSQYKSLRESGLNRKVLKKDGSMSIASSMSINT